MVTSLPCITNKLDDQFGIITKYLVTRSGKLIPLSFTKVVDSKNRKVKPPRKVREAIEDLSLDV